MALTPETTTEKIRVLVLDDDESMRLVIYRILSANGCVVETAGDGRAGLHSLLQSEYDVLLVDLHMDVMDGFTFLTEALNIHPWLGVVAMSGDFSDENVDRIKAIGPYQLLAKPLTFDDLHGHILREARRKQEYLEASENKPLIRLQYQLSALRKIGETAIGFEHFIDALNHLCTGLAQLMPCTVITMLGKEREKNVLIHNVSEAVAPECLENIEQMVKTRYVALSGDEFDRDSLIVRRIDSGNGEQNKSGQTKSVASTIPIPIISEGNVIGMICLSSTQDDAYDSADKFFLYHAANHVSTVMMAFSRLHKLAIIDGLTGLFNRQRLEEELERLWELCERYDHSMAVVVVDVDHFKNVNDKHGHLIGDQVLKELSNLIMGLSRTSDFVGRLGTDEMVVSRFGGDEMVVILPYADVPAGKRYAKRVMNAIKDHVFCETTVKLKLTLSLGIATHSPTAKLESRHELVDQADKALYHAKANGRNQICVWSEVLLAS